MVQISTEVSRHNSFLLKYGIFPSHSHTDSIDSIAKSRSFRPNNLRSSGATSRTSALLEAQLLSICLIGLAVGEARCIHSAHCRRRFFNELGILESPFLFLYWMNDLHSFNVQLAGSVPLFLRIVFTCAVNWKIFSFALWSFAFCSAAFLSSLSRIAVCQESSHEEPYHHFFLVHIP